MGQIQPRWPLRMDPYYGPYASVDSVAESIHQDFLQLLKTMPGEWPMNPDLGIGLIKFLFELPNSNEFSSVKSRIKSQVAKYLAAVEVTDIDIQVPPDLIDSNQARIKIEYYIKPLGLRRTLGLIAAGATLKEEVIDAINNLDPVEKSPYKLDWWSGGDT